MHKLYYSNQISNVYLKKCYLRRKPLILRCLLHRSMLHLPQQLAPSLTTLADAYSCSSNDLLYDKSDTPLTSQDLSFLLVTPRSRGYGDVTATYIRRSELPSRIYAKHQYRQESEYESSGALYIPTHIYNYKVITRVITILHEYHITSMRKCESTKGIHI